jgi:tetratricopeptide (TPR) repeat protein
VEGSTGAAFAPWRLLLDQVDADTAMLQGPSPGVDPHVARSEQFDAVLAALRPSAQTCGAALFIDDAQWLGASSRELLSFLAAHTTTLPLLIVVALRDTALGADSVVAELSRYGVHLTLAGLDEDAIAELVTAAPGARLANDDLQTLQRVSEGNPLFAIELSTQSQAGLTEFVDGARAPLPARVRQLLLDRTRPLTEYEQRVLVASAVAADAASLPLLARALSTSDAAVAEALDAAWRCGVLLDPQRPDSFMHPLMRAAVIDDTDYASRIRLHQQIAEGLMAQRSAGIPVSFSRIAGHLVAAAPAGSAADAVEASTTAAREAFAALAYEEAARWYGQALSVLDLAPDASDRLDLLMRRGEAEQAAGHRDAARSCYLQAAALASTRGAPVDLAKTALAVGSGGGFEIELFDDEQQSLLSQALDALSADPAHEALRARLMARLSVARSFTEPEQRRERVAAGALALARSTTETTAVIDALGAWCDAIAGPADVERRLAASAEMLDLSRDIGDVPRELLSRRMRVVAFFELGDFAGVADEVSNYELAALRVRQPIYDWYVPLWRATLAWAAEEDVAARAYLERAREASGSSRNAPLLTRISEWFTASEDGEPVGVPEEMVELMGGWDPLVDVWLTILSAYRTAIEGSLEAARAHLFDTRRALSALPHDSEYLPALVQAATAAALAGDTEIAPSLYDALVPHRDRFAVEGIGAYCHGSVERHLGMLAGLLGRADDAAEHFGRALTLHRALGAKRLVRLTERASMQLVQTSSPAPDERLAAGLPRRGVFRPEGDGWRIGFDGDECIVRDSKGMGDLARLIRQPGREMPALDLVQATASHKTAGDVASAELGEAGGGEGDVGDVVDAAARTAYRARLADIEGELSDADVAGDTSVSLRLALERDALVEQLSQAYGLGGRPRRAGDRVERARSTVTARIRDAIRRIEAANPALGRHLSRSVRTGRFCVYDPEVAVQWDL